MFFLNKNGEVKEIPKYVYIDEKTYYTYLWKEKYNINFEEYNEESNDIDYNIKDQKKQILHDILK